MAGELLFQLEVQQKNPLTDVFLLHQKPQIIGNTYLDADAQLFHRVLQELIAQPTSLFEEKQEGKYRRMTNPNILDTLASPEVLHAVFIPSQGLENILSSFQNPQTRFKDIIEEIKLACYENAFIKHVSQEASTLLATHEPDALPQEKSSIVVKYRKQTLPEIEYFGTVENSHYFKLAVPVTTQYQQLLRNPFQDMSYTEYLHYVYFLIHDFTHQREAEVGGQKALFGPIADTFALQTGSVYDIINQRSQIMSTKNSTLAVLVAEGLAQAVEKSILEKELSLARETKDEGKVQILKNFLENELTADRYSIGRRLIEELYQEYGFRYLIEHLNLQAFGTIPASSRETSTFLKNPKLLLTTAA